MAKCDFCGKGVTFGIKVSHSHRRSNRAWKPNVKRVKAIVDGAPAMFTSVRDASAPTRLSAPSDLSVMVQKRQACRLVFFFMPADRHKSVMTAGDLRYNSSREMVEQERKTEPENRSGITDSVKFGNRFRAGGGSHALIVCCAHLRHLWCLQKPPSCRFRTRYGCRPLRRTAPS